MYSVRHRGKSRTELRAELWWWWGGIARWNGFHKETDCGASEEPQEEAISTKEVETKGPLRLHSWCCDRRDEQNNDSMVSPTRKESSFFHIRLKIYSTKSAIQTSRDWFQHAGEIWWIASSMGFLTQSRRAFRFSEVLLTFYYFPIFDLYW